MPDVVSWTKFAEGLRPVGLRLFAETSISVTEDGAADLKALALMLLARTLSNLQGALMLLKAQRLVEARILTRCCYENQYWTVRLLQDGGKFRSEMVHNEMRHKRERMQHLFETRIGITEDVEIKMREWMRANKQGAQSKTLNPKAVAMAGPDQSYVFYQALSMDAHPSIDTLNRYYVERDEDGVPGIDVEPKVSDIEMVETLNFLCLPVIGTLLAVNELLGNSETPAFIGELAAEYQRLTIETGKASAA